MTLELAVKSQFPDQLVRDTVKSALRNQAELARFRHEQFARECQNFEHKFNLTTEEFVAKFDAGEMGDAEDYFDWFAAARGRAVWKQKASILGEVAG
jgi:hypothetical protein